jgi:AcrR family transcriptional regulator
MRGVILDAATRLFAERGFDATPLQAVAEAAGIRKPSLLYHFSSKEELREAVLARVLSRWSEVVPRLLLAATAGDAFFDSLVGEVVGFFSADPSRARLLLREVLDRPADMERRLAANAQSWLGALAASVRRAQKGGDVRADLDPEPWLVHVTLLLVAGVATQDLLQRLLERLAPGAAERARSELVRIARASLFAPAPEG